MNGLYVKLIAAAVVASVILCLGLGCYFQYQTIQNLNKTVGKLEGDLNLATATNNYANALAELQSSLNSGFAKAAAKNAESLQALQQGVSKQNESLKKALAGIPCANEHVPDIAICVLQPSKCTGGEGKGIGDGTVGVVASTEPKPGSK